MAATQVLFDTDIGSDIDDALALSYLLKQADCRLLGITTVSGDTNRRAALAEIVCRAAGREDIPIHAGLAGPLLTGPGQPNVPQFDAVATLRHRTDYANTAVNFLRDTIRAHPGEITLLGVGPMTNLAVLFALDPEIPSLLKRVVLMCGVYTSRGGQGPGAREWNALIDPVATAIVYKQAAGKLLGVGLDVTTRVTMPVVECRARFARAGGPLAIAGQMAEVWFQHANQITFHDPLAAALIFVPDLCTYERGAAYPVIEPEALEGLTRWEPGGNGPHTIATTVDADRFLRHYFGVVG
jgi:purine nucleosidase